MRNHDGYNALGTAFATAVCLVAYVGSEVLFVGILAVGSTVGTLVELYNWRTSSELLRFD